MKSEGCFYIPFLCLLFTLSYSLTTLSYIFIILITIDSIEFQRSEKIIFKKSSKIFCFRTKNILSLIYQTKTKQHEN